MSANMDWADRAGGRGSIVAGGWWLVASVAAACACVVVDVRSRGREVARPLKAPRRRATPPPLDDVASP